MLPYIYVKLNTLAGDYGKLSESDRRCVMADVKLSLPPDIDLCDSNLLVIDDIRITGAHEQAILDVVLSKCPKRICKMYII
jgi:hypoxanthine phosphoribosyltransferase